MTTPIAVRHVVRSLLVSVATVSVSTLPVELPAGLGTPVAWASDAGGLVPVDPPGTVPPPRAAAPEIPDLPAVRISSPSTISRLNMRLGSQFKGQVAGANVEISARDTSAALEAVQAGDIDLAMIDRPLSDAEQALGLVAVPIGENLAYVYNGPTPSETAQTFLQFVENPENEQTVQRAVAAVQPDSAQASTSVPEGTSESESASAPEAISESTPASAPGTPSASAPEDTSETASASAPEVSSESAPETISELAPESGTGTAPESASEASSESAPETVAERPQDTESAQQTQADSESSPSSNEISGSAEGGAAPDAVSTAPETTLPTPPSATSPRASVNRINGDISARDTTTVTDNDIALLPSPGERVTDPVGVGERSFPWGWLLVPLVGLPLLYWLQRGKTPSESGPSDASEASEEWTETEPTVIPQPSPGSPTAVGSESVTPDSTAQDSTTAESATSASVSSPASPPFFTPAQPTSADPPNDPSPLVPPSSMAASRPSPPSVPSVPISGDSSSPSASPSSSTSTPTADLNGAEHAINPAAIAGLAGAGAAGIAAFNLTTDDVTTTESTRLDDFIIDDPTDRFPETEATPVTDAVADTDALTTDVSTTIPPIPVETTDAVNNVAGLADPTGVETGMGTATGSGAESALDATGLESAIAPEPSSPTTETAEPESETTSEPTESTVAEPDPSGIGAVDSTASTESIPSTDTAAVTDSTDATDSIGSTDSTDSTPDPAIASMGTGLAGVGAVGAAALGQTLDNLNAPSDVDASADVDANAGAHPHEIETEVSQDTGSAEADVETNGVADAEAISETDTDANALADESGVQSDVADQVEPSVTEAGTAAANLAGLGAVGAGVAAGLGLDALSRDTATTPEGTDADVPSDAESGTTPQGIDDTAAVDTAAHAGANGVLNQPTVPGAMDEGEHATANGFGDIDSNSSADATDIDSDSTNNLTEAGVSFPMGAMGAGAIAAGLGSAATQQDDAPPSSDQADATQGTATEGPATEGTATAPAFIPAPGNTGEASGVDLQAPVQHLSITPESAESVSVGWMMPEAQKTALLATTDYSPQLKLYDVTAIDLNQQPAHSTQTHPIEGSIFDGEQATMIVPVPLGDRDYLAEVGYVDPAGNWRSLGRSLHTHVPPLPTNEEQATIPTPLTPQGLMQTQDLAGATPIIAGAVTGRTCHQQLVLDGQTHAYLLDERQQTALQSTARSTPLTPGCYVITIEQGYFNYWTEHPDFSGEPLVILWIHGGRMINRQSNVEVTSLWKTLNGYNDVLTLEVLDPVNVHAFFFDSYKDDNSGQVFLLILKDE